MLFNSSTQIQSFPKQQLSKFIRAIISCRIWSNNSSYYYILRIIVDAAVLLRLRWPIAWIIAVLLRWVTKAAAVLRLGLIDILATTNTSSCEWIIAVLIQLVTKAAVVLCLGSIEILAATNNTIWYNNSIQCDTIWHERRWFVFACFFPRPSPLCVFSQLFLLAVSTRRS